MIVKLIADILYSNHVWGANRAMISIDGQPLGYKHIHTAVYEYDGDTMGLLEKIFTDLNGEGDNRPADLPRSMCVGDIVKFRDGAEGSFWICRSNGWQKIPMGHHIVKITE